MGLIEYSLLSLGSLFAIINALAAIPAFVALTPQASFEARARMARTACICCAAVLMVFGVLGRFIFKIFGISMPAFQTAGGLILILVALDMLRAHHSAFQGSEKELALGAVKEDVAITPLAIPMLSGPGAISTVIVLSHQAATFWHRIILYASIVLATAASFGVLYLGARGAREINKDLLNVITRLMGLLLAAIGVQFIGQAIPQLIVFQK